MPTETISVEEPMEANEVTNEPEPEAMAETAPDNILDTVEDAEEDAEEDSEESDQILPPPLRADSPLETAMEAFDEYMIRKGFSENTVKAFRNDLKILKEFMAADTLILNIKHKHLEEFLEWMQHERGKPCSAKTLARRITTLKVFFSWLHGVGVIGTDPAEPVLQQSARPPLPIILQEQEVRGLLSAAQDYLWSRDKTDARPYLLVSLLVQTGIKKAECARLLISDLDIANPKAPELAIRYAEERHAHKNRTIVLDGSVVPVLQQYLQQYKPENYLFECTPRNLEYVLAEVGERAKIQRIQVGFETLRWTSAVRDFRTGTTEETLRHKMGLSKISWRETRDKIFQLSGRNV